MAGTARQNGRPRPAIPSSQLDKFTAVEQTLWNMYQANQTKEQLAAVYNQQLNRHVQTRSMSGVMSRIHKRVEKCRADLNLGPDDNEDDEDKEDDDETEDEVEAEDDDDEGEEEEDENKVDEDEDKGEDNEDEDENGVEGVEENTVRGDKRDLSHLDPDDVSDQPPKKKRSVDMSSLIEHKISVTAAKKRKALLQDAADSGPSSSQQPRKRLRLILGPAPVTEITVEHAGPQTAQPSREKIAARPRAKLLPKTARTKSQPKAKSSADAQTPDVTKETASRSHRSEELTPLESLPKPQSSANVEAEHDQSSKLFQAGLKHGKTKYQATVECSEDEADEKLDLNYSDIIEGHGQTNNLISTAIEADFLHLEHDDHWNDEYERYAYHLVLCLREVVDLMTGLTGKPSVDRFVESFNNRIGTSSVCGSDIIKAAFHALLTTRVYHKQDLLEAMGVPDSEDALSKTKQNEGNWRRYLAEKDQASASRYRFVRRSYRRDYLETPAFKAKVAAFAEEIMLVWEDTATGFFNEERLAFEPEIREIWYVIIERAIVTKCKVDLSHYKCEIKWAPMQSIYDKDYMRKKVVPYIESEPPDRREAALRRNFILKNKINLNRVRFATTPAWILRKPAIDDKAGREEWEIRQDHLMKPKQERGRGQYGEDDGFDGKRFLCLGSEIIFLNGSLIGDASKGRKGTA